MTTMKGFYRVRDTDGDDAFDEFTLLKRLNYGYEHSAHSIIETADGKGLYLVSGNYTRTPEGTTSLQPPVWREDSLLTPSPIPWDTPSASRHRAAGSAGSRRMGRSGK